MSIVATVLALLTGYESRAATIFSTRTSPDGSRLVENGYDGDGEDGGRLVLRSKDGSRAVYNYTDTAPDAFMRWLDDHHLEIWREGRSVEQPVGPVKLGDVQILNYTYVPPPDVGAAFERPNMPIEKIDVGPSEVAAAFTRHVEGNIRHCVLTLATTPQAPYEPARVEIDAQVNPTCARPRPCSSIATLFSQGYGREQGRQTMLTSATISNIKSYNRLAFGSDGTSLHGVFLEDNATRLMEDLGGRSITLDFSLDFYKKVVKYVLNLTTVTKQTTEFDACVGDADMSWMRH